MEKLFCCDGSDCGARDSQGRGNTFASYINGCCYLWGVEISSKVEDKVVIILNSFVTLCRRYLCFDLNIIIPVWCWNVVWDENAKLLRLKIEWNIDWFYVVNKLYVRLNYKQDIM